MGHDDDNNDFDEDVEEFGIGGGRGEEIDFLGGFGGERNALIFRDEGSDAVLSYSLMRFVRSSLEVIDTRASRSSDGNWQRRLTDVPHNSPESSLSFVFGFCVFFLCLVSKHKKILLNGFV